MNITTIILINIIISLAFGALWEKGFEASVIAGLSFYLLSIISKIYN